MGSVTGKNIKLSIFGESHGKGIGVVIDGLPSGIPIDMEYIQGQMARRAPGSSSVWSTKRKEPDIPDIISGVLNGRTTGTPLCAMIKNTDTRSSDYSELQRIPRPGHADLTAILRYCGASDPRGGGHFSGRLTAAMVFAGAVCLQALKTRFPMTIYSHICSIGNINDSGDAESIDKDVIEELMQSDFPVLNKKAGDEMIALINQTASEADSIGGVIETVIKGFPKGIGDPIFDGMESKIASIVFSVPAVKGIEFGSGFKGSSFKGSQNNDELVFADKTKVNDADNVGTKTNNSGGILGGITNGMPIVFRAAVKPTASIGLEQNSVDLIAGESAKLKVKGRHDPCIVPRAIPVIESVCAVVLLDSIISSGGWTKDRPV